MPGSLNVSLIEDGHISTPLGYRATGVACGLKETRARDLALVYSLRPCHAAALFTANMIFAAPIFFNQAILSRNRESIRAVLINAGNANAGTGQQGLTHAIECAKMTADELETPRDSVLLLSTGQIGMQLPIERMRDGIRRAASELDSGAGRRAAIAIMAGDTRHKDRAMRVPLREGRTVTLAGMAKGGRLGLAQPVSVLCVLTTDAAIETRLLHRSLELSSSRSFGRLALDGLPSPNDAIMVLANGASDTPMITDASSWEYGAWQEALDAICYELAQQVVRDTASPGKMIQVQVRGAASSETAARVAHAVAASVPVRAACVRGGADWGSILVAIGASGAELRPDLLELRVGTVAVMIDGVATRHNPSDVMRVLSGTDIELVIDLHTGSETAIVWTCMPISDS